MRNNDRTGIDPAVFGGDLLRGGIGVLIGGALLLFLLQPKIRAAFA
jgi:hypothetical protein